MEFNDNIIALSSLKASHDWFNICQYDFCTLKKKQVLILVIIFRCSAIMLRPCTTKVIVL